MIFHKWTRILLLIPLLLSLIGSTPAQAQTSAPKLLWCPATVTTPRAGQYGCTPAFTSMTALWTHLTSHEPSVAGTIWIGAGYDSLAAGDGNLGFDGEVLTKMAKYPLSFKGGWKGQGMGALNLQSPATLQGHTFSVFHWKGKVTIRNFNVVLNAASAASACDNAAVCVQTAGGILLDRVHVEGVDTGGIRDGAILDNRASLASPPGSVVVTNSQFLNNRSFTNSSGLLILTNGAVTLKQVEANNDTWDGVVINNTFDATGSPVTVTNGKFNENDDDGLDIASNGTVTLTNLYAQGNAGHGTFVDNTAGVGNVVFKGINTFLGNVSSGLFVRSKGNITARYLLAYYNDNSGVWLDNSTALSAKGVNITGSGEFIGNLSSGLSVRSKGNVSINRVIAADGDGDGIGISIEAENATLTCSHTTGHNVGLSVTGSGGGPLSKLILQGFLSYGNTLPDFIAADSTVSTACPTG